MRRIALALLTALLLGFGLAAAPAATAAPAPADVPVTVQVVPAGNGTNNFYLTGGCHVGNIGGVDLKVSNWDVGANQRYHLGWTRSGSGYSIVGIYIDGFYVGKSSDFYKDWPGHGSHGITIKVTVLGAGLQCYDYV